MGPQRLPGLKGPWQWYGEAVHVPAHRITLYFVYARCTKKASRKCITCTLPAGAVRGVRVRKNEATSLKELYTVHVCDIGAHQLTADQGASAVSRYLESMDLTISTKRRIRAEARAAVRSLPWNQPMSLRSTAKAPTQHRRKRASLTGSKAAKFLQEVREASAISQRELVDGQQIHGMQ